MGYLKYVDGLRTLAVMLVIATHVELSLLEGGYIGVDVFFVISGYLITRLLLSEYEKTGTVNFGAFFWRRVRRLMPAVIATVLATFIVGFLVFADERFFELIRASIFSVFSLANIFFWAQVGYFDTEASYKPLLHLWSLGVEEQFYLFWPIFIFLSARFLSRTGLLWSVILVSLASFFANYLMIDTTLLTRFAPEAGFFANFDEGMTTTFFWFPFRIFEFGIGAFIALFGTRAFDLFRNAILANIAFLIGLTLVVGASVVLKEDSIFPYYNALYPAIGTGLLIASGKNSIFARILFENAPAVYIGKISYSLYLVHWPIVVYYKAVTGNHLDMLEQIILVLLMFPFAILLNKGVEDRFRFATYLQGRPKNISQLAMRLSVPVVMIALSLLFVASLMVPNRIPSERVAYTNAEWRQMERNKYCTGAPERSYPEEIFACARYVGPDAVDVVVWGDSHAGHLVGGLSELFPQANILVAYVPGCTPQTGFNGLKRGDMNPERLSACENHNRNVLEWSRTTQKPAVFIISAAKRDTPEQAAEVINSHIDILEKNGHQALMLGDFIRPGVSLQQCMSVPSYIITDKMLTRACETKSSVIQEEMTYSESMATLISNYVPVKDIQCPDGQCQFFIEGQTTHRDDHHLSIYGSIMMLQKLHDRLAGASAALAAQPFSISGFVVPEPMRIQLDCSSVNKSGFTRAYVAELVDRGTARVVRNKSWTKSGLYESWTLEFTDTDIRISGEYIVKGEAKPIQMTGTIEENLITGSGRRGPRDCTFAATLPTRWIEKEQS